MARDREGDCCYEQTICEMIFFKAREESRGEFMRYELQSLCHIL